MIPSRKRQNDHLLYMFHHAVYRFQVLQCLRAHAMLLLGSAPVQLSLMKVLHYPYPCNHSDVLRLVSPEA